MELVITCLRVTVMRTLKEKTAVHQVSTLVFMCIGQIPHRFCKFWIMSEVQVTNRLPHVYVLNCGKLFVLHHMVHCTIFTCDVHSSHKHVSWDVEYSGKARWSQLLPSPVCDPVCVNGACDPSTFTCTCDERFEGDDCSTPSMSNTDIHILYSTYIHTVLYYSQ